MAKDIATMFKRLERQSYQVGVDAMREVAKRANVIAYQTAIDCLQQYYTNYSPKRYRRTGSLKKAIGRINKEAKVTHDGNKYSIRIGTVFNSGQLANAYKSTSWYHQSGSEWISYRSPNFNWDSQANGIVDPGWVLNNFLTGKHPNGLGFDEDPESTDTVMTKFYTVDIYDIINGMVPKALNSAVSKFLGLK